MSTSQIIYIGIIRDKKAFLCDYSSAKGNFIEMVKTIIQRVRYFLIPLGVRNKS